MTEKEKKKEFEDAIAEFGPLIAKICFYFSSNKDEFQDLRQETLLNVWKGWDNFNRNSKISTWIYRICFNTCVSFQRKERISKTAISIDEALNLPAETESHILENYNMMHRLIGNLSFEDRAIILMWLDEKSYDEMAELIGLNRNTLAVRLKRIKEKLVRMSKKMD